MRTPQILIPTIVDMIQAPTTEALFKIKQQQHSWYESDITKKPLESISCTDICRSYNPSGTILIDQISVNGSQVAFPDLQGTRYENQFAGFKTILGCIYKQMGNDIVEEQLDAEVELMLQMDHYNWGHVQKILDSNPEKTKCISQLRQILSHPSISWSKLEQIELPTTAEKWKNLIIQLSIPWVNILRLGTVECFSHADSMLRNLYPQLYSIPFVSSSAETKLAIDISSTRNYEVSQLKKIHIHLRSQPDNPACNRKAEDLPPIAVIEYRWMVIPSPITLHLENCWLGQLTIESVAFTSHAALDEQDLILRALMKPHELKDDWEIQPLPAYVPKFIL